MSQTLRVASINSLYPEGATPITASSGNVAAGVATATLTCPAGKTMWLTGATVTGAGSTAGAAVSFTITGLVGGTQTYAFTAPTGVLVGAVPLDVDLFAPIPATGVAVNIVGSLPSLGAGSTNASVVLTGFYL